MRISARTEYGLRAMIELANHYGLGPIGVREIASRQGIPERFLEQLISSLRRAGLVTSQRGAQGGFVLAKPAVEVTVFEIMEALEGPLNPVSCLSSSDVGCEKDSMCATQNLWRQAKCCLEMLFRATNLESLRKEQSCFDSNKLDNLTLTN